MSKDVVIACGIQKAYLHESGSRYFGHKSDVIKVRLLDYLSGINKSVYTVFYVREVHQTNDSFYREVKSYGLVGSSDIEIPEVFKPYVNFIINSNRYNALYKTGLESELSKLSPKKVYLVGMETHTNILFTAEELRNREIEVIIPEALVMSEHDFLHDCAINILSNTLSTTVEC